MVRTFLTLLFGIFGLGASAQAIMTLDKTTHDFGVFPESKVQKVVFVVTNTGDKPLVIQQAFSSCGCTVADFTKNPIPAGAKGEIVVTYDGKGKFEGHFKKAITIRSNATNNISRIFIEGTMEAQK